MENEIKAFVTDPVMQQRLAKYMALRCFRTTALEYLKALSQAKTRFDLDGLPAGEITPEQRQQAKDMLHQRYQKTAERKKAEQ